MEPTLPGWRSLDADRGHRISGRENAFMLFLPRHFSLPPPFPRSVVAHSFRQVLEFFQRNGPMNVWAVENRRLWNGSLDNWHDESIRPARSYHACEGIRGSKTSEQCPEKEPGEPVSGGSSDCRCPRFYVHTVSQSPLLGSPHQAVKRHLHCLMKKPRRLAYIQPRALGKQLHQRRTTTPSIRNLRCVLPMISKFVHHKRRRLGEYPECCCFVNSHSGLELSSLTLRTTFNSRSRRKQAAICCMATSNELQATKIGRHASRIFTPFGKRGCDSLD